MKKLLAYTISGDTVGVDLLTWKTSELDGNQPFKIISSGETIPSNYIDISSIENWDNIGIEIANDYLFVKKEIKNIVKDVGWNNLSDVEKDLAIKYYAYDSSEDAVTYLLENDIFSNENKATEYLTDQWHIHHGKVIESLKIRWYYVKLVTSKYLSFKDSLDVFDDTVTNLLTNMFNTSLLGHDYGDSKDGIMDFLESTNGFENNGLRERDYTLRQGTWDSFIYDLKDVLVNGNYNKYE